MTTRTAPPVPTKVSSSQRTLLTWTIAACVVIALGLAWQLGWLGGRKPQRGDLAAAQPDDAAQKTDVQLTEAQLEFAKLGEAEVIRRFIRETRTVPGRVTYDGARHLEITSPVDSVVREVLVEPGQMVNEGDRLVVLSSAEVGRARDEVLRCEADLELAKKEHSWAEEIFDNVEQLLSKLSVRPSLADLERQLESRPLGNYREKLVAAYSKLLLAESVTTSADELEQKGSLSRRIVEERRSNREIAAATFKGACENARFEAMRDHVKSHAGEQQAARLLVISREHLATLLGPQGALLESSPSDVTDEAKDDAAAPKSATEKKSTDEKSTDKNKANDAKANDGKPGQAAPGLGSAGSEQRMSEFYVRAPFAGRIEERHVIATARVSAGKPLFSLANTKTLWVEAEVHERDWRALEHAAEGKVMIRVPALNDAEFSTRLRFVGARVSAETRSVPLVVELANEQGKLKPGLFVWVDVPLESEREALVVPPSAIMRHEDKPFVFVPLGERRYRRVDVTVGLESRKGVEIVSGLKVGQRVVTNGTFFLKSELLLDKEAD